LPIRPDARVD